MHNTVLLVDDEPYVLYSAMRNLHEQPLQILTATDVASAKRVLITNQVDLVVSDENMPGGSGTALLKWVADEFPHIVRIVLTGSESVEVAAEAINQGQVFRYLQKPCHPMKLAMAIWDGLESSQITREADVPV